MVSFLLRYSQGAVGGRLSWQLWLVTKEETRLLGTRDVSILHELLELQPDILTGVRGTMS